MKRQGRAENVKPWKPGTSGTAGGRPKRDMAAEIARSVFERNEEAIRRAMTRALLKGDLKVLRVFVALAERAYGKVKEPIEVSGLEGLAERIAKARMRVGRQ